LVHEGRGWRKKVKKESADVTEGSEKNRDRAITTSLTPGKLGELLLRKRACTTDTAGEKGR